MVAFILVCALLGILPAAVAASKGRSFIGWWLYGALLFIIALPHALLLRPDRAALDRQQLGAGMRQCPSCAELIRQEAKVCRYCGRDLPGPLSGIVTDEGFTAPPRP